MVKSKSFTSQATCPPNLTCQKFFGRELVGLAGKEGGTTSTNVAVPIIPAIGGPAADRFGRSAACHRSRTRSLNGVMPR
jgi:hypothetical protein